MLSLLRSPPSRRLLPRVAARFLADAAAPPFSPPPPRPNPRAPRAAPSQPPLYASASASAPTSPSAAAPATHPLPLPGGDLTRSARCAAHTAILSAYARIAHLPPHAQLHAADVVPSSRAIFVGVGRHTNWSALHAALQADVFNSAPVVAIRDVFDRHASRAVLSDCFAVVADDVIAVRRDLLRPGLLRRRFVNHYARTRAHGRDEYQLVRNDVELIDFIRTSGFRVVAVDSPAELAELRSGRVRPPPQQSTNHVLACAPTAFAYNVEAASDNHFMNMAADNSQPQLRRAVLSEFAALHAALTDKETGVGAHVHLFTHDDWHDTPDACFPNNTFSTHTNFETDDVCALVLYPMKDPNRRRERRLVQRLLERGRYTHVFDLTREEVAATPAFLEGTGSLVLDRVNRLAYVALSQRSDLRLASAWARMMGYTLVPFTATDRERRPIYHTNVMMAIGTRVAVLCAESIADERERAAVRDALATTGHIVVDISLEQVDRFCGNVIELESFYGEQMLLLSKGAHAAFDEAQKEALLGGVARLVHADIPTIEKVGGGGVRCTIAELF